MFQLGPTQQANLTQLVEERSILRLRLAHNVDLNEIVEHSHTILGLLQLAQANRLSLGEVQDDNQRFRVPGEGRWEQIEVLIKLNQVLSLDDFAEPLSPRPKSKRKARRHP
jgi:hypothetical protein